jgi:hypothetical protein
MSVSNILGPDGKIKALYLRESVSSIPEGLAEKIEALEEFARLLAEVVAIQLEDGSTYHYTGVPQGIQPLPVSNLAEVVKEPDDPVAMETDK